MKSTGTFLFALMAAWLLLASPVVAQTETAQTPAAQTPAAQTPAAQTPAGADTSPGGHITKEVVYNRLITDLMCLCGCKTTLKTCPHTNCDFAIPRKREILAMLDQGADYDGVVKAMVGRFGERILPAPTKEGFNLVGYILPFVAILAVGALLVRLAAQWARRGQATTTASTGAKEELAGDADLRKKMEQELADFD